MELTKLDLPDPVEPATSRCGIFARFAEMNVHVDEPRHHPFAGQVVDDCVFGNDLLGVDNAPVPDPDIHRLVDGVRRINDPAMLQYAY